MREAFFAIPGDLASPTGGYAYARGVLDAMPQAGWRLTHLPLPDGFPDPGADDLARSAAAFDRTPADSPLFVDGLAFGTLPKDLLDARHGRWLAMVHHPLALETGLAPERAAFLKQSEHAALARASGVVVPSPAMAEVLTRDYAVQSGLVTVAPPGTLRPDRPARGAGGVPSILCVGTLSHRKGQETLVEALARLQELAWHCRLVGSDSREPEAAAKVRDLVARHGLAARIEITGALEAAPLAALYRSADLFALPTRYEGYGMVFAEALAHGLPIVACPTGAVPGTVPREAAFFVPPDAPDALAEALRRMLTDPALRASKAAGAWAAGRALPGWSETARKIAGALTKACS